MIPSGDFQQIRKEYENQGIDESSLPEDPMELFRDWYQIAEETRPGAWLEPNCMSLATAEPGGRVSNRYVLLKGVEPEGICFFTNYQSLKGQQLEANPQAAAALHWPYLGRQVRIEGPVERTSREASLSYFQRRPRGAQIGAVASQQSSPLDSRDELDHACRQLEQELEGQDIPLPSHWGGFLIRAQRIEFWQGRANRLHDRIVYQRSAAGWSRQRIAP